jgi:hypothetical protein
MAKCEPRTGATDATRPPVSYRGVSAHQSFSSDALVRPDRDLIDATWNQCGDQHHN